MLVSSSLSAFAQEDTFVPGPVWLLVWNKPKEKRNPFLSDQKVRLLSVPRNVPVAYIQGEQITR